MAEVRRPVRVALVNDYEIVLRGLEKLLAPYHDRVTVVEVESGPHLISVTDVVLVDTFAMSRGLDDELATLRRCTGAKLAIFSWHAHRALVEAALEHGADAYLAKGMAADELVSALERTAAGEQVVATPALDLDAIDQDGGWPGPGDELTPREAEVLALIAQGLSNREIAARMFLSVNSVKTHIRTAYRKIGAARRSQAVMWALDHGLSAGRH